jgi:hypothetical protein
MQQVKSSLANALFYIATCIGFCAFTLVMHFYAVGSNVPDPKSGRTFPIQMHGTMYVTAEQGWWFYGLLATAVCLYALWLYLTYVRRRSTRE